jgi:DNA-binding FadR family transcriptional regulator
VVEAVGDRIRDGSLAAGAKLPREADLMAEFGVSRTVVREAISRLQAAGMVDTRHGVGTFVVGAGDAVAFRIDPERLATLQDVIDVLELRIALETECAGLAAARRTEDQLQAIREALAAFVAARESGQDAGARTFSFTWRSRAPPTTGTSSN